MSSLPRLALLCLAFVLAASASERDVAEWVMRLGGRVIVEGNRVPLRDVSELPQDELQIRGLDFTNTTLDPGDLEKISLLTGIRELYLPGPSWNPGSGSRLDANDQLRFLSGLTNLKRLYFSLHFLANVNVQDKGFAHLAGLTQLEELRCSQCRIAADGLAPFTNLRALDLNYATIGDEGIKSLKGMKELRRLLLRDTLITDQGLRSLLYPRSTISIGSPSGATF